MGREHRSQAQGTAGAVVAVLLLLAASLPVQAQEQRITLDQAIDLALKNNGNMQSSRLAVEREKLLKGTAAEWGRRMSTCNTTGQYR